MYYAKFKKVNELLTYVIKLDLVIAAYVQFIMLIELRMCKSRTEVFV